MRRKGSQASYWRGDYTSLRPGNSMTKHQTRDGQRRETWNEFPKQRLYSVIGSLRHFVGEMSSSYLYEIMPVAGLSIIHAEPVCTQYVCGCVHIHVYTHLHSCRFIFSYFYVDWLLLISLKICYSSPPSERSQTTGIIDSLSSFF